MNRAIADGSGSSPHTRGARRHRYSARCQQRIIPAYAGSTQKARRPRRRERDHPRIRGEHCPHGGENDDPGGIIPAYAGSTSLATSRLPTKPDHPRIRGEHWPIPDSASSETGSSPHTRGARVDERLQLRRERIIPAYAGSTDARRSSSTPTSDHPRIRGEHHIAVVVPAPGGGSSPHTRGARGRRRVLAPASGIIPAYAGSTTVRRVGAAKSPDHPRIRGEHPPSTLNLTSSFISSPHTRGAPLDPLRALAVCRIIPAYAGSTYISGPITGLPEDHPRIRGEHALAAGGDDGLGRIIPAYAGSTSSPASPTPSEPDHPRIRGEHWRTLRMLAMARGSSPHTRGAPSRSLRSIRRGRIIPAYAGSTRNHIRGLHRQADHPRIRGEHQFPFSVVW